MHTNNRPFRNVVLIYSLIFLGLLALTTQAFAQKNLAQGKQTVQSCTYGPGVSSRAVDGNTNGDWAANSVSHTCHIPSGSVNWFMVDLGGSTEIQRIELWNRTGTAASRLENYVIFVSERSIYEPDVPSGTTARLRSTLLKINQDTRGLGLKRYDANEGQQIIFTPTNKNNKYVRRIQGTGSEWTGRYVTIGVLDNQYDNDYLNLAEIKVFGEKTDDYTDVQVHGHNVQLVKFNAGNTSGRFIQTGGGEWQEQYFGRPALTATLKETNRDEWSVYLRNESNGYSVKLDLHDKIAYSTPPNGQRQAGTRLFSAKKLDPNGYNLTEFRYYDFRRGPRVGEFRNHFKKIGAITWRQIDYQGQEHTFEETNRDDTNVYLRDSNRNINIIVDTFSRRVLNLDPEWFEILEMNAIPTSAVLDIEVLDYLRINERSLDNMVDWMVNEANRAKQPVCWKDTYGGSGGGSCKTGYEDTGLICQQLCSGVIPQSTDCGAGCATSTETCVGDILNQSLAVTEVLTNVAGAVVTGGTYNAAKSAAKAAIKGGSRAAAKAAFKKAIRIGQRQIADELKDSFGAKLAAFARQRSRKTVNELARTYSQDMVERSGEWLAMEISERAAGRIAAAEAAQDPELREIAELFDPTGIAAVVNAFDKNSCYQVPFPR